jgi:signal peptidase I
MSGYAETGGILQMLKRVVLGENPRRTFRRLSVLVLMGAVAVVIFNFILLPIQIVGPSMTPTFRDGEINLINRLSYLRSEPKRGDVVGIMMSGKHTMFCKRIIGMPGELVAFLDGKVMINGIQLNEPYLKWPCQAWKSQPKQLGSDEYYFVGDNRSMPFEDHEKGAAQRKRIVGKVLFGGSSSS